MNVLKIDDIVEVEALIIKYSLAYKRNAHEMAGMPITMIQQHFREFLDEYAALAQPAPSGAVEALPANVLEDAAKSAFVKAQSVYRSDHDHFPLTTTWETTLGRVREGWRSIAYATLEAAYMPPLGTQPEPRKPRDVASAVAALAQPAAQEGWRPTHRHKKRGSEYQLLGIGKMQAEHWVASELPVNVSDSGLRPVDMREVAIYVSKDGDYWVRPREEFEDGRFETIPAAPSQGRRS